MAFARSRSLCAAAAAFAAVRAAASCMCRVLVYQHITHCVRHACRRAGCRVLPICRVHSVAVRMRGMRKRMHTHPVYMRTRM